MTFSYHAEVERAERMQKLSELIGFTKVVFEVVLPEHADKRYCITSSGIIIIKRRYEDHVITAYIGKPHKYEYLYMRAGKGQIPPKLYKKNMKNCKRHSELLYM